MFRVKQAGGGQILRIISIAMFCAIVVATLITTWLAIEVRKEQAAIADLLNSGSAEAIRRVGTFSGELRWQFAFSLLVLFVLLAAGVVLVSVLRAHLTSQESLRKVKVLARDILASMDQAVVTTDCECVVASANRRLYDLTGLDDDCVGRPLQDVCQDAPLHELSRKVLQTGHSEYDHDFAVERNGQVLRLRAACHALRDTDDRMLGSVLHVRDVTERILIEERMRRMERYMGLGTLAAGLHHEIKNPLGALSLHVQLLEEQLGAVADDEVAESLGVLKMEVTRISGVLESFRDFASLDELSRSPTDLAELIRHTLDLMQPTANLQGVRLSFETSPESLPAVDADAARLEQVLLNLIVNALQAMRNGGDLVVSATLRDKRVDIAVKDTGAGIPESVRARIFDPYFTTKSDGAGMGLAICDKIVQQHGGEFECETSPNGTLFHILLPVDAHHE